MQCCLPPVDRNYWSSQILSNDTCGNPYEIVVSNSVTIPKNMGDTLNIIIYKDEGELFEKLKCCQPAPTCELDRYVIQARARQFICKYCICDDIVLHDRDDKILNRYADFGAKKLQRTQKRILKELIVSLASSVDAVYGTNKKSPTNFSERDHLDIIQEISKDCAEPFFQGVCGKSTQGSTPLPPSYLVITHTDLYQDISKAFGCKWWGVESYGNCSGCQIAMEWGYGERARFIFTSDAPTEKNANGDTVYTMSYFAADPVWGVDLEGRDDLVVLKPKILSDADDCYQMLIKAVTGYVIPLENRIINLKVTRDL